MIDFAMLDIAALAVALFLGAVLSGIFFGALWLTLCRLTKGTKEQRGQNYLKALL